MDKPSRPQRHQLFQWGIHQQKLNRGSIGAARTRSGSESVLQLAIDLLGRVLAAITTANLDRSTEAVIEQCQPTTLLRAVRERLAAKELVPACKDASDVAAALRQVTELQGRLPSLRLSDIKRICAELLAERLAEVRRVLGDGFGRNPKAMAALVGNLRRRLAESKWPEITGAPLRATRDTLATYEALAEHREELVPESYAFVRQSLLEHGTQQVALAWDEAVTGVLHDEWKPVARELGGLLTEIEERAARFGAQAQQVSGQLAEEERALREHAAQRDGSTTLVLPGTEANELITGMLTTCEVADLAELAARLSNELAARLVDLARRHFPHVNLVGASLATLVLDLPANIVAGAWRAVVHDRLGAGHSLYARVARLGIERTARFLWERSAPTCSLGGRGHARFGVEPTETAIVKLPTAVAPQDVSVRSALARTINSFSKKIKIVDAPSAAPEISCCRMLLGFPAGIETTNRTLMHHYRAAAEAGHPMHLIGVMPDSEGGGASKSLLALLVQSNGQARPLHPEN